METHDYAKPQNYIIRTHSKGTCPRLLKTHSGLYSLLGINIMDIHKRTSDKIFIT